MVLVCFGAFRGDLGASLGPPGVFLGPLGASWGALGGILGPLGRLLGRLGGDPKQHKNNMQKKSNFQTPKKRTYHVFGVPFGGPKSTKIDTQNASNFKTIFKSQKIVFKSLLGPSWADLAPFWAPSWGSKNRCGIGRRSVS